MLTWNDRKIFFKLFSWPSVVNKDVILVTVLIEWMFQDPVSPMLTGSFVLKSHKISVSLMLCWSAHVLPQHLPNTSPHRGREIMWVRTTNHPAWPCWKTLRSGTTCQQMLPIVDSFPMHTKREKETKWLFPCCLDVLYGQKTLWKLVVITTSKWLK